MALLRLLVLGMSSGRGAAAAGLRHDGSAFVQGSVSLHHSGRGREGRSLAAGSSMRPERDGPVAHTRLGPVRGVDEGSHLVFWGVPYAEPPERFAEPRPKEPWAPATFNATAYPKNCIGAAVNGGESEDCLHMNIWVSKGEHKNLPVIVYFHGGINQHGSGSELWRWGDGIVQSAKYPAIFINFDFRLGIFGWIDLPGSNISRNLGFLDQQAALRFVRDHIEAFGGDPGRVTLQGQSEGGGAILYHMVAPGSGGLFHRAVLHSLPADMWSRHADRDRTDFMIAGAQCKRPKLWSTVRCLKRKRAAELWTKDWISEELSRNMLSPRWTANFVHLLQYSGRARDQEEVLRELGWHAVIDNATLLGEPRELIRQGRWNKVPVLMTVSNNESYGVLPGGKKEFVQLGLSRLVNEADLPKLSDLYRASLEASGVHGTGDEELYNMMLTDKMFTCDSRALADEMLEGGGHPRLGLFWHSPKFDPVGTQTSPICDKGATCHAAEMLYVLPQGPRGIQGRGMEGELEFAKSYSESFLAFVYGKDEEHPWALWNETRPITLYGSKRTLVVPGYRGEQCDVVDSSMNAHLPEFMRRRAVPQQQSKASL